MTRHRWGRAVSARWLSQCGGPGRWIQVCLECFLRRIVRLATGRRGRRDLMGNRDTRGAWTVAVCRDDRPGGYRPARTVGPCPRRTA